MVLTRFRAICGPGLAHFHCPFGLQRKQNLSNICSKWAHSNCLCTPNRPKIIWENASFDPFLTHFWSQNNPFSRHLVSLEGPKWLAMGSKSAHYTSLCTPNGLGSFLERHIFDPFLTHFCSQNGPFSRHFVTWRGQNALQWAQKGLISLVCAPQMVYDDFWKKTFLINWSLNFCSKIVHSRGILSI